MTSGKRKLSEDSLRCSVMREFGVELLWNVPNVSQLLKSRLPVTSEWLEVGGIVCELLLQPFAATCASSGQETLGLLLSAVDGREGHNLPETVRFQVVNQVHPAHCQALEEGRGVLRLGRSTWATEELIPMAALRDPGLGFVERDSITIQVILK